MGISPSTLLFALLFCHPSGKYGPICQRTCELCGSLPDEGMPWGGVPMSPSHRPSAVRASKAVLPDH